jgi:CheY-like chemotaxis protein
MNGYVASLKIKKLIREENYIDLKIIAYTSNTASGEATKCTDAGMDGYLVKPSS